MSCILEKSHLSNLRRLSKDFGACETVCFSRDTYIKNVDGIKVFPWQVGIETYLANR